MKRKYLCYTMMFASMILCSCGTKEVQTSQNSQAEETVLETENETDSVEETIPYLSAAESFAGGDGTKENPFQIATAEQLVLLSEVNSDWSNQYNEAYYVLTSDIQLNDLSDYENWEKEAPEYQWKPVSDYFKGNFDGDGHTIRGMYVQSNRDQTRIGLFDMLYKADVSNVNLEKSCLKVNHLGINAGGIAGSIVGNISIENCFTDIDIYVNDVKGTEHVGGIVGWSQSGATIKNCTFQGDIDYRDNHGTFGGIVGYASETVVANCEARGSIIAKNENADNLLFPNIGGIIGSSSNAVRIENCTNYMDISGTIESLGGICGVQNIGDIFTIDQNGNSIHTNGFAEIINCKTLETFSPIQNTMRLVV